MAYNLKVDQDAATYSCVIFIDRVPQLGADQPGGVDVDLAAGEHSLTYDVRGPGAKVSISLAGDPPPTIIVPATEPPVSEPTAISHMPSATATAPPDVEPPGTRVRSAGFAGVP